MKTPSPNTQLESLETRFKQATTLRHIERISSHFDTLWESLTHDEACAAIKSGHFKRTWAALWKAYEYVNRQTKEEANHGS